MTENTAISRKERDRLLREEDFLNAAEKLFGEKGYQAASMEDIAGEAGYATGTIYRYFGSKEDLLHRILLRKGRIYYEKVHAVIESAPTPFARLKAILDHKVDFFFTNRDFMKIYVSLMGGCQLGQACRPPEELEELHQQFMKLLENILHQGIRDGTFRDMPLELTLCAFTGITNQVLQQTLEDGHTMNRDQVTAFILEFIQKGLLAEQESSS